MSEYFIESRSRRQPGQGWLRVRREPLPYRFETPDAALDKISAYGPRVAQEFDFRVVDGQGDVLSDPPPSEGGPA